MGSRIYGELPVLKSGKTKRKNSLWYSYFNGIIIMSTFSGQNLGNKIVDQQRKKIKEAIHEESKIDSEKDDDNLMYLGKLRLMDEE